MPVYPYIWNALVLTFLICSARGHTSESLRSPSLCRHQCSAHDEANYAKHSDHYAFIRIIETARDPTISESDTNTASGRSRRCPRTSRARRRSSRRMYTAPVAHAYRAGPPSGGRPHHIWTAATRKSHGSGAGMARCDFSRGAPSSHMCPVQRSDTGRSWRRP